MTMAAFEPDVTKLGDSWKFLMIFFLAKVVQYIEDFLAILKKSIFK